MVGHAFYGTRYRASLEPSTYRRLRRLGFDGVAITDSLSLVHDAPVERWAPQAARAGADMLLFTEPGARGARNPCAGSRSHAAASSTVTSRRILRLRR